MFSLSPLLFPRWMLFKTPRVNRSVLLQMDCDDLRRRPRVWLLQTVGDPLGCTAAPFKLNWFQAGDLKSVRKEQIKPPYPKWKRGREEERWEWTDTRELQRFLSPRPSSGCTNHSRIRPNIYFQNQLDKFQGVCGRTPGGHIVNRCLNDLMFEV